MISTGQIIDGVMHGCMAVVWGLVAAILTITITFSTVRDLRMPNTAALRHPGSCFQQGYFESEIFHSKYNLSHTVYITAHGAGFNITDQKTGLSIIVLRVKDKNKT